MQSPTQFFTVRLWKEQGEEEEPIVRGRVEHVLSREVRYVGSLEALARYLAAQLESGEHTPGE